MMSLALLTLTVMIGITSKLSFVFSRCSFSLAQPQQPEQYRVRNGTKAIQATYLGFRLIVIFRSALSLVLTQVLKCMLKTLTFISLQTEFDDLTFV